MRRRLSVCLSVCLSVSFVLTQSDPPRARAVPEKQLRLAFRIFDVNGDGTVDRDEFMEVLHAIMSNAPPAARPSGTLGLAGVSSAYGNLLRKLFGDKGERKLSGEEFVQFSRRLHEALADVQFEQRSVPGRAAISPVQFAQLLVMYAPPSEHTKYFARVAQLGELAGDVTKPQFLAFQELVLRIDELRTAMELLAASGTRRNGLSKGAKRNAARPTSHLPPLPRP